MIVKETAVYRGPNLYSRFHTVIRLILDLEELEEYPSDELGDFTDRLIELLPGLWGHRCSVGKPGGFIERLRRGTWMGHIIEHVALELQSAAGTEVTFGKTRGTGTAGTYSVVFEYLEEQVGRTAGKMAVRLVQSLLPAHLPSAMPADERAQYDFAAEMAELKKLVHRLALGPSTSSLVQAARKRGIPWFRLNDDSLVQLGYGKYQKRIQATITSNTNYIAVEIAGDKRLTNQMLNNAGIPVPRQVLVDTEEEAVEAAQKLGCPLVTKPLDLNHGRGASMNLVNEAEVREGFRCALKEGGAPVLIEQYLVGRDYRVLVVNDQVIAVAERVPGHVVGDGRHTIRQLVDLVNADPRRGEGHENILTKIYLDYQAEQLMARAGVTPDTVLSNGQVFFLRATANISTGATAIDRTDEIAYENIEMVRRAVQVIGLDVAGVDIITPDISRPIAQVGGGIIEINAAPGFRMHVAPAEGQPRDVAGPVIDMLFPPGTPSRIPIAAITGTNGKTTTAFMVSHILKIAGHTVGTTTSEGIFINGNRVQKGDMSGPQSARIVLSDPTISAAVLETARGGILREGVAFDRCTVGAVLNISSDHLGLKGINTLEQMAEVKSIVVENVMPGGYAVLNADDPLVTAMAEKTEGEPVYFCMSGRSRLVRDHIAAGGKALVCERGINGPIINLYEGDHLIPLLRADQIPATLGGKARFNIINALAASAVAYTMGASLDAIRSGLMTFTGTFEQAPGRFNIFDDAGFRVIVNYAHNPAAVQAISDMVRVMRHPRKIGVLAAAGDRRNEDIRELGQIVAEAFTDMIFKEDIDRRGRKPGETAGLMKAGSLAAGMPEDKLKVIEDEFAAVEFALRAASPGDLVVIFADDTEGVWNFVSAWANNSPADHDQREDENQLEKSNKIPEKFVEQGRRENGRQRVRAK